MFASWEAHIARVALIKLADLFARAIFWRTPTKRNRRDVSRSEKRALCGRICHAIRLTVSSLYAARQDFPKAGRERGHPRACRPHVAKRWCPRDDGKLSESSSDQSYCSRCMGRGGAQIDGSGSPKSEEVNASTFDVLAAALKKRSEAARQSEAAVVLLANGFRLTYHAFCFSPFGVGGGLGGSDRALPNTVAVKTAEKVTPKSINFCRILLRVLCCAGLGWVRR